MTYALICCVAGVWGIIFYRVFAKVDEEQDLLPKGIVKRVQYFKLVDHQHDTIQLSLDYGDPFLQPSKVEMDRSVHESPGQDLQPRRLEITPAKPMVNWTGIQYIGRIFNSQTNKNIAIININGKEAMLNEGETMHGLKFMAQTGDSIKVSYLQAIKYLSVK